MLQNKCRSRSAKASLLGSILFHAIPKCWVILFLSMDCERVKVFQDYSPVKDCEALSTDCWPQNTELGTDLFSVHLIRQLTS